MPSSTASLKGQPKHAKMAEQFFFPSLLSMTDDLYSVITTCGVRENIAQ